MKEEFSISSVDTNTHILNGTENGWWYSSVAIMVEVLAFSERNFEGGVQGLAVDANEEGGSL
jgi:hypothetical protein